MGILKNGLPTNMRELRLWHYQQKLLQESIAKVQAFAAAQQDNEDRVASLQFEARRAGEVAALHEAAVEVLNDVLGTDVSEDLPKHPA